MEDNFFFIVVINFNVLHWRRTVRYQFNTNKSLFIV